MAERWTDERLDRFADKVDSLSNDIQQLIQALYLELPTVKAEINSVREEAREQRETLHAELVEIRLGAESDQRSARGRPAIGVRKYALHDYFPPRPRCERCDHLRAGHRQCWRGLDQYLEQRDQCLRRGNQYLRNHHGDRPRPVRKRLLRPLPAPQCDAALKAGKAPIPSQVWEPSGLNFVTSHQ